MARHAPPNKRHTAPSFDDAASSFSSFGPHTLTAHRLSHTGVEQPKRTASTWGHPQPNSTELQTVRSNLYAGDLHDTMLLGERIRARRARDDVAALVDFLKNHPPPPDNYMSIPYEEEDDSRGRWSKIKSIARRSKSVPREPQQLRLPDSAVAGMTIGGHRHIAISIPWEATPFGDDARSQYPVFTRDIQAGIPSKEPVRTYKNEKGVVTVLRPVTEVHEVDHGSIASKHRSPSNSNSQGLRPPPLPPHKPTSNAASRPHDYIGVLPITLDTPLLDDSSAPWHIPRGPESQVQNGQNGHKSHQAAHPVRASSMVASGAIRDRDAPSIDRVIQHHEPLHNVPIVSRGRYFLDSYNGEQETMTIDQQVSAGDSINNYWQQTGSTGSQYAHDIRHILNHPSSQTQNPVLSLNETTFPLENDSCPPSPGSTRSRKDIVREKKRRDMEAMRHAKLIEQHKRKGIERENAQRSSKANGSPREGHEPKPAMTKSKSALALSNVMVVVDVKPSCESEEEQSQTPSAKESEADEFDRKARTESPIPLITINEPSIPTPPISAHGSPPQRQRASDRTSLTRRREWKAIRDQERKAREAMAMAKAKAKAQQLASGGVTCENGTIQQADKDVLRLYEAYREHRLRDMERRLLRLERNGGVWLQALAPVLDNMNRALASTGDQPSEDPRDWASDGETSSGAQCTSGDTQRKRITRRSSLSQGSLLEKLVEQKYSDEAWSEGISKSDDSSGFGTIEPLMRELARESRRWQRTTTQSPVVTRRQSHAM